MIIVYVNCAFGTTIAWNAFSVVEKSRINQVVF